MIAYHREIYHMRSVKFILSLLQSFYMSLYTIDQFNVKYAVFYKMFQVFFLIRNIKEKKIISMSSYY